MGRQPAGKYAGHLHKLTKLGSTEPPAYQQRVELRKSELRAEFTNQETITADMAKRYRACRDVLDELEEQVSMMNVDIEAISQLLIESQEQGGEGWGQYGAPETTLRLINGDTVRVQAEPYTATEDRDAVRDHFMSHEDLKRQLSPAWATLNALNKERLLNGEPELPGTKIYVKTKLVYTSAKAEKSKSAVAEAEL